MPPGWAFGHFDLEASRVKKPRQIDLRAKRLRNFEESYIGMAVIVRDAKIWSFGDRAFLIYIEQKPP